MTLRRVLGGLLKGRFPRESGDFFTHILGLGGSSILVDKIFKPAKC